MWRHYAALVGSCVTMHAGAAEIVPVTRPSVSLFSAGIAQIDIALVERMPSVPQPWIPADWLSLARNQTALVFNLTPSSVPYTPLLWWDDAERNFPQRTFGVPSYVGEATSGEGHEEIAGGSTLFNEATRQMVHLSRSSYAPPLCSGTRAFGLALREQHDLLVGQRLYLRRL
jgi:hypothetical protein